VIKYANLVKDKEREVEKARQVVDEVERGQGEMMEKRKNSRKSFPASPLAISFVPDASSSSPPSFLSLLTLHRSLQLSTLPS